jgi:2-polyprenyl-6-methoxyphenol hydroxylase-like FAD-dependent oxidoreductase
MNYDLAIVGGGLAGSSLGSALARAGARVIIFEREPVFRDRVRGEGMLPWGAAEARELGIHQVLTGVCAQEVRWLTAPDSNRDLIETTPSRLGFLNFSHPEMQQCLLDSAVAARVELRRPAEVTNVIPGDPPTVVVRMGGAEQTITARLVVGADGRNSQVRRWSGFEVSQDPDCLTVAGTLYRGLSLPEDAVQMVMNPDMQRISIVFPIGDRRFRAYLGFRSGAHPPLSGQKDVVPFVEASVATGTPGAWFGDGENIGPLASFNAPDCWADHPYRDGVVLIGDAAAASDPTFGCGLSLTLRDVRVLRDLLATEVDWAAAAAAYADEHDRYYSALHRTLDLWRELFFDVGPAAEALRARALPLIGEDPSRMADFIGLGPEAPNDEAARRRFFGHD